MVGLFLLPFKGTPICEIHCTVGLSRILKHPPVCFNLLVRYLVMQMALKVIRFNKVVGSYEQKPTDHDVNDMRTPMVHMVVNNGLFFGLGLPIYDSVISILRLPALRLHPGVGTSH